MQTGEAQFTFPVPYEQAEVLKAKPDLEVVAAPSIVLRYLAMNTLQKPFDNPKVRQAIAYAINKEALAKVAFNGYATPADGVAPEGVEYAVKIGVWPYDVAKAKQLMKEAGYPDGFETELWSAYNHSHRAEGNAIPAAAAAADRHQDQDHPARGRPARGESRELAGPGDCTGAPVLRRLVDIDRRSGLGAAPAARRRILAAEAFQQRLLQERKVRRRYQGRAADDQSRPRRRGCTRTRRRPPTRMRPGRRWSSRTALGAQQEADRGVRDSRRVVQFHRHRFALAAARPARASGRRCRVRGPASAPDRRAPRHAALLRRPPARPDPDAAARRHPGIPVRAPAAGRPGPPGRRPGRDPGNRRARAPGSGPRSVPAGTVSALFRRRAARRLRPLAAHQAAGIHRDRRTLLAHVLADRHQHGLVGRHRHGHRHRLRRLAQSLAGPRGHDARRLRHLLSRLCARHAADADLRRATQLAADGGRRHLAPLHPAFADAGRRRRRHHGALYALVVPRHSAGRLRAHRARQGSPGEPW